MRTFRVILSAVALTLMTARCTPDAKKCSEDSDRNVEACRAACNKGDMPSCLAAAHTFDHRFEKSGGVGADAEQGAQCYEKACMGGDIEACRGAIQGVLLGPSVDKPELPAPHAVERAVERRRAVLAKACSLGDQRLCVEAADAHLGYDRNKAEQFGRKACLMEFADRAERSACEAERTSLANQAQVAMPQCDTGKPGSCLTLGNIVHHADRARAREAFAKECEIRHLVVDSKPDRCVEVFEKAVAARKLPVAEPSITDRHSGRVILRSLVMDPSRPERPSAEQVREQIDKGTAGMQSCYAAALSRNPKLTGTVALQFTIDGLGEPFHVRENKLELLDLRAVECIKLQAAAWRFPAPNRGTIDVEADFAFRLEDL